jgi:hypothetical protein
MVQRRRRASPSQRSGAQEAPRVRPSLDAPACRRATALGSKPATAEAVTHNPDLKILVPRKRWINALF